MEVRITTLSENTANYGCLAEWGLSILVEVDGMRILMDTGLSSSAVHNTHLMGIDLSTVNRIILSHGHADHTGGLVNVLKIMRKDVEIIAHPDVWASKYTRRDGQEKEQYIGIPFLREELDRRGARFNLSRVYTGRHLEIIRRGKEAKSKTLAARKDYHKTARDKGYGL